MAAEDREPRDLLARQHREPRLRLGADRQPEDRAQVPVQGLPAAQDRGRGRGRQGVQGARPGAADPQQGPLEQRPRAQPRRRRDAHAGDGPDPRRRRGEPHGHRAGRRDQRADRRPPRAARPRAADHRRPPRHHGRRLRVGRRHQPRLAPLRHVHRQRAGARVRRLGRRDQALQPRGQLGGLLQPARRARPPRRHHRGDAAPDRDRQVPDDLGEPPVALPLDGRLHRRARSRSSRSPAT